MQINFKKLNFGQLILMKISETAATRQHKIILKLKCTNFDFGWGLLRGKRNMVVKEYRYRLRSIGIPQSLLGIRPKYKMRKLTNFYRGLFDKIFRVFRQFNFRLSCKKLRKSYVSVLREGVGKFFFSNPNISPNFWAREPKFFAPLDILEPHFRFEFQGYISNLVTDETAKRSQILSSAFC